MAAYSDFLDGVQTKASQLSGISIFQNDRTGYDLKNIELTAQVYAGLTETPIDYFPQKGLYTAISYAFTDLILLASMLLLALILVRQERDSGLLSLVRSLPGGRLKTALAKLAAFAASLWGVLLVLYGVNLAYCSASFGLGSAAVLGGSLFAIFCAVFAKAQLLPTAKRSLTLALSHTTRATSVPREEGRKLLLMNGAAVFLAAFLAFGIYQGITSESYLDADEIYYAYYMKHISGPWRAESYNWLTEQGKEFAPMLEVQRRVIGGELSSDALLAYNSLQQKYTVYQQIVQSNIQYYLKQNPGAWLVYETGYKKLFGFTGTADVQDTLLAGLLCALCFSGLFAMERKGGMDEILATTPLGRKYTVKAKLRQSTLVAAGIAFGTVLPHLWQILRDYGLPALLAPAMSISELQAVPKFVTLSDLLLFWLLCRFAACLCMSRITLWLGQKLGNLLPALFISAVAYCLPALLSLSGMKNGIEWLGFYPLFHAAALWQSQGGNTLWVPIFLACTAFFLAWAIGQVLIDDYDMIGVPDKVL